MENQTEDLLIKRIALLGLILAILFGILNYIPAERTYDSLTIEAILKVFSTTFFNTILVGALIYLLLEGINLGYKMKEVIPKEWIEKIYNIIILISFMIIVLIIFLFVLINLMTLIPFLTPKVSSYILILAMLIWFISFITLIEKYVF